jgi:hypothetical protein
VVRACANARATATAQINEIGQRLTDLQRIRNSLAQLVAACDLPPRDRQMLAAAGFADRRAGGRTWSMRLMILHVRDCPNVATLRNRLSEVIAGRGDVEFVERRVVDSEDVARKLGMTGSPTLLVDGRDPFDESGRSPGLSCRLYRDENGDIVGAPSVAQLRRVLEPAASDPAAAVVDDEDASG